MRTELSVDEGLPLVEPPERVPPVGPQPGALALAGAAGEAGFLVEGARAAAAGPQRGPIGRIVIDGEVVAADVGTGARAVNVVCAPGLVRRELVGEGGGTRLETVLAFPTMPVVAAQWTSPARPETLTLSLTVLPEALRLAYRTGRACAVFERARAGGSTEGQGRPASPAGRHVVALGVHPAPSSWSVCPSPDGGARVTIEVDATDTATLLLSAGSERQVRSAATATRHLGAHARQAAEGFPDGFSLVTGQPDVDDVVPWARARLHVSLLRLRESEMDDRDAREEAFWGGLGACAAGDLAGAERALALLEAGGGGSRAALLAARIALAFGRQTAALRHAGELLDPRPPSDAAPPPGSPALRAEALSALADALRHAAPEDVIDALRAAARAPAAGSGRLPADGSERRPADSGRLPVVGSGRLPVVGSGGAAPTFADWLRRALAGAASEEGLRTTGHRPLDAALTAWSAFRREPDVAWAAWGIHAARGLTAADGPGTWDPPDRTLRAPGRTAGALLAALAHGFLRIVPDAPSGRIGLGPCIGGSLRRFRADGIALGRALVRLDYERDGSCHRFQLSGAGARVPPVVVFDPIVRGRVSSARIDGAPADLDLEHDGIATRAPVQISLDATRTVELFVDA